MMEVDYLMFRNTSVIGFTTKKFNNYLARIDIGYFNTERGHHTTALLASAGSLIKYILRFVMQPNKTAYG